MARHDQAKQQRSRFETLLEGRNSVSFEFSSWRGAATHAAQHETLAKTDRNENRRQPKSGVRRFLRIMQLIRFFFLFLFFVFIFVFVLAFVFVLIFVFVSWSSSFSSSLEKKNTPPPFPFPRIECVYRVEFIGSKIFVIMFVSNVFWQPAIRRYYNVDRGIACDVAMRCIIKISIHFRVFMYLNFSETREIERINTIVGNSREKLGSRVLGIGYKLCCCSPFLVRVRGILRFVTRLNNPSESIKPGFICIRIVDRGS